MPVSDAYTIPRKLRRPQFHRVKPDMPLKLTTDDYTVLRALDEHRFRRTPDLIKLLPHRSPKKLLERFRRLYDHGYVDRPLAQQNDHTVRYKPHTIYALGNKGAEILGEIDGTVVPRSNWTKKNQLVKRPHLQHTLRIADISSSVGSLPHCLPSIAVMAADTILQSSPKLTQDQKQPWSWTAHVQHQDGSLKPKTAVPDFVFGLDLTDQRQRFYFFCEADRRTEPVLRSNPNQSSVGRKFEAYLAGYHAELHTTRFGIGNLRFLIVTTTEQRIRTMRDALKYIAGSRDCSMFFFATADQVCTAPHILAVPWINVDGTPSPLITFANKQEQRS